MSSITRRSFVQAGAAGAAAHVPAGSAPNVLFIMLNQWRFDCLGDNDIQIRRTLTRTTAASFSSKARIVPKCARATPSPQARAAAAPPAAPLS